MTAIIIFALTIWAISAVTKSAKAKQAERNRQAQIARINAENMKRKAEIQRMKANAKVEVARMVAIEREQMRQAKEQKRQAAILAKHEEEIAKLKFKMSQAEANIEHLTEQLGQYYALLDVLQNQQMMAVPGSKADVTAQGKIITLQNKIHTAESRLEKAKFDKEQAERKIA